MGIGVIMFGGAGRVYPEALTGEENADIRRSAKGITGDA